MAIFKIYTDEKITLWQRVGLIIEAESEEEARAILANPTRFNEIMFNGGGEYSGEVDPYWETEDHLAWEHDAPTINLMEK